MSQSFQPITYQPSSVRLPEEQNFNPLPLPLYGLDQLLQTRMVLYRERPAYGCFKLPITEVMNEYGHILYQVKLEHWACCDARPPTLMTDLRNGSDVARFELDQTCGCCPCIRAPEVKVTVRAVEGGQVLGVVQLDQVGCFRYEFQVTDGAGRVMVRAVNATGFCMREVYNLLDSEGMVIGRIRAEGYQYYCYRMEFPDWLDVATKATLISFLNLLVLLKRSR